MAPTASSLPTTFPAWFAQHALTPKPLAPLQPAWPLVADSKDVSAPRPSSLKYAHFYPWSEVASVFHLPIHAACEVR